MQLDMRLRWQKIDAAELEKKVELSGGCRI